MSMFIVRLHENRELVALVFAQNKRSLFWSIDELTDPFACEYRRVSRGGILFGKTGELTTDQWIGVNPDNPDDYEYEAKFAKVFPQPSPSEHLWEILRDGKPWKRFEAKTDADYRKLLFTEKECQDIDAHIEARKRGTITSIAPERPPQ